MVKGIVALLLLVLTSVGCTAMKDEALPLSEENLEKYSNLVIEATKKIDPSAGTPIDRAITALKIPMEKKVGYSFDKTLRHFLVKGSSIMPTDQTRASYFELMNMAESAIKKSPDEALSKGLITQRTYELIKLEKENVFYRKNTAKYVQLALECQSYTGTCIFSQYVGMLLERGLLPEYIANRKVQSISDENNRNWEIVNFLSDECNFDKWGRDGLATKPDGTEINTFKIEPETAFLINQEKIQASEKYNQLVKEEI